MTFNRPKSIWGVVSVLLPKSAYGVVDGAADFVTDLSQLLAERELSFIPVPVVVPPSPTFA